jgi:hypothetical protein
VEPRSRPHYDGLLAVDLGGLPLIASSGVFICRTETEASRIGPWGTRAEFESDPLK